MTPYPLYFTKPCVMQMGGCVIQMDGVCMCVAQIGGVH